MKPSYNLMERDFIPVRRTDGLTITVGLRDALVRAHEYTEIADASPLVAIALHRLLLAVLHRNFGPNSLAAWKKLWQAGRFDTQVIDGYCARWRARFDLFDDQYPFYQDATLTVDDPGPASKLAHELAAGNNATLFDHRVDAEPDLIPPDRAARLLVAQQAYAIGGGNSARGYTVHAPLIGTAAILVTGATLFETLLLNLVAYSEEEPFAATDDRPVWEQECRRSTSNPQGYLDYLTWQSRAIHLHPEPTAAGWGVRRMSLAQGRKFEPVGVLHDPMVAYRRDEDAGYRPVRLSEHRALWRDSHALFQLNPGGAVTAPRTFNWLARLVADGVLPPSQAYAYAVGGLCTDRAKIHFWRLERMPLPLAYLSDSSLVDQVRLGLEAAEKIGQAVRAAVWKSAAELLSNQAGLPRREAVATVVDALAPERAYWSALETPFRIFFLAVASDSAGASHHLARWVARTLRPAALRAYQETAEKKVDRTARQLRAASLGRLQLQSALVEIVRPYEEILHEHA